MKRKLAFPKKKLRFNTPISLVQEDFPDSKINKVKICSDLNSYNEAINLLNTKAHEIFNLSEVVSSVNQCVHFASEIVPPAISIC